MRCWTGVLPRAGQHGARGIRHERGHAGRAAAALLWLALTAAPAYADPRSELAQARHDLAISEQVLARMTERAAIARSDPAAGPEQRQRLDEQVERVQKLVAANRERVRNLSQTVAGLPEGSAPGMARDSKAAPAATQAEEVAALEARLGVSLTEFDQLLLEEARRARTRGATGASGSLGGYGGGTAGKSASKGSGTGSHSPGAKDRGKDTPDSQRTADAPESQDERIGDADAEGRGVRAERPGDVGDGGDDDIVEGQIRRAAESERDPALREKLWDEYRKYKQRTKG